jgi:hypothetical protein
MKTHILGIIAATALILAAPVAFGMAAGIVWRLFYAGWKLVMP